MYCRLLVFFLALATVAFADVKFTAPAAGAIQQGASTWPIAWVESGSIPLLADLTNYVINLCAGGNDQGTFICSIATIQTGGSFAQGYSSTANVPANAGPNSVNGYFLQIISTSATGTQVTNYSPRFGLTNMVGSFPVNIQSAVAGLSSTDFSSPATTQNIGGAGEVAGAGGPYAVPYNLQTGLTRYAPMQPHPGTKITATSAKPQWPTSSVVRATTWLPLPSIQTTITQAPTYSTSSIENTVAPAAQPSDDMAKYLARWKD